jgi:Flp pilus assembly protein TadD
MGNYGEGQAHLREALRLKPNDANAHYNLGRSLAAQGRLDESISSFLQAVRIDPGHAEAYFNLGLALERQGKVSEAINNFNLALRLRPDWPRALSQLAFVLATHDELNLQNPGEALQLAERAVSLTKGQHPLPLDALAAAYARAGRLAEAVEAAQKAVEMATASGNQELATTIGSRLQKYRNGSAQIDAPKN